MHATHEQRICLVPALKGFRASPSSYYGTAAIGTGAGSGPPGLGSMLFFGLFWPRRATSGTDTIFSRGRTGVAGWHLQSSSTSGGTLLVQVHTAAAGVVQVVGSAYTTGFEGLDVPYLALCDYQDGVLTVWSNGILVATSGVAGGGFLAYARPTTIGVANWTAAGYAVNNHIADCGMLQGYDVSTYVDPIFGNGGPGLSARWLADLREGRYLTWPRAAAVGSDWYWAARDAVLGAGTIASWPDRYTGDAMLRFGQPQGASAPARPV